MLQLFQYDTLVCLSRNWTQMTFNHHWNDVSINKSVKYILVDNSLSGSISESKSLSWSCCSPSVPPSLSDDDKTALDLILHPFLLHMTHRIRHFFECLRPSSNMIILFRWFLILSSHFSIALSNVNWKSTISTSSIYAVWLVSNLSSETKTIPRSIPHDDPHCITQSTSDIIRTSWCHHQKTYYLNAR